MVKNILKGIKSIPLPPFNQGLQAAANRARQNALGNLGQQQLAGAGQAAAIGQAVGGMGGVGGGGFAGGLLSPQLWSDEMMAKLKENQVMSQMASGMYDAQSAVPPPQTCPLSKAIIMEALLDLMELQPDMHMGEILRQVMSDSRHRTYDVELAQTITGLVDSLRSSDKNDSSSDPRPFDSSEHRNPRPIGLSGGVPPSRLPYAPHPVAQLPSEPGSEPPDLFLPLG